MARQTKASVELPHSTMITVVARKGKKVFVKDMTYGDALKAKAEDDKGFAFTFYQLGFTSEKPTQ